MFRISYVPSLFLISMGSLDCLTTAIGKLYFGTVELNPLMANLINISLAAFVVIKLAATACVCMIFVLAERALSTAVGCESRAFGIARMFLLVSYTCITLFLIIVVVNNFAVIFAAST